MYLGLFLSRMICDRSPSALRRIHLRRSSPAGAPARPVRAVLRRRAPHSSPSRGPQWEAHRRNPAALSAGRALELIVAMAPHVSRFLARLFSVGPEAEAMAAATRAYDDLFRFKIDFVRRRALPLLKAGTRVEATRRRSRATSIGRHARARRRASPRELALARDGCALLDREEAARASGQRRRRKQAVADEIESLKRWCAAHVHDPRFRHWVVFRFPETLDPMHLVHVVTARRRRFPSRWSVRTRSCAAATGFKLTDQRYSTREVLSEIHYCVLCHERDKDTLLEGHSRQGRRGHDQRARHRARRLSARREDLRDARAAQARRRASARWRSSTIDNPMCPGTGHRICNDCMKACIYQKQEPVNIPQIETGVLTDVLKMPWGVEIYGLLTRWNPLNVRRPYALPYNGRNVLVVGLGPAGYTLAHYLVNEGFGVVAIDGLKIEPLPEELTRDGRGEPPRPIRDWNEIYRPLDERVLEGFGGVSEYGITVRWDKNFLTLIHLTLARREKLRIYGGIRFGGALPLEEAWEYGFDHVAIAAGAGRPTIIDIKNNLIRGIRKASDFLMALQLTGAFKADALSNLQVRLPAVVIGGGLTGIDTATELLAYYPLQVEKILERYEALVREIGESDVRGTAGSRGAGHSRRVPRARPRGARRARARGGGRRSAGLHLARARWGGVTLAYRKRMQDSPAYRLNHEEVSKALEEGIAFAENLEPVEAVPDEFGHVAAMVFTRKAADGTERTRRAAGAHGARRRRHGRRTSPTRRNIRGTFQLDSKQKFFQGFRAVKGDDGALHARARCQRVLHVVRSADGRFVSYYGDNHPRYNGNVVKAMASAKDGYPHVVRLFEDEIAALDPAEQPTREAQWQAMVARLDEQLLARVERVVRLTPTIVEVIVRAPAAARHFHPGQFYRLQNFERLSPHVRTDGHRAALLMEGIALTGAWVDREQGLLSLITLEMGVSSRLCAYLQPGEPVVVMGPTGTPTEIPENEQRAARGRRPRQRRAVLDRQGAQGQRQPRDLFRRLQERRRSLQARGDRRRRPIR